MIDSNRKWSDQQTLIFDRFKNGKGNVVVRARAGTGKTTTILEGINYAPENKILLAAFNKKIAEELKTKLKNPAAQAKTLHSIGYGFVMRNWGKVDIDGERAGRLAKAALFQMGAETPDNVVGMVSKLAALGKNVCPFPTESAMIDLAYAFDLDPDENLEADGWTVKKLALAAMAAMELATVKSPVIDFDDMVFIPVRMKWVKGQYDLVVVDECQDMNATQIALARGVCKPRGRIFVIGDDRQAIYGFRGADSGSLDRLKNELSAEELGLTITYRCPQAIVRYAQGLVPDYMAAPSAPEGLITSIDLEQLHTRAKVGNFILSRKNSPLAQICLRLLREGIRARIEGRDIGAGLLSLIKKLKSKSIPAFLTSLASWEQRQITRLRATKKESAEAKISGVIDQAETLRVFAQVSSSVEDMCSRIVSLFAETPAGKADYVICSSVHKSKGLESDTVFVLEETLWPVRGQEEDNIAYVAVTRAKKELVWVHGIS